MYVLCSNIPLCHCSVKSAYKPLTMVCFYKTFIYQKQAMTGLPTSVLELPVMVEIFCVLTDMAATSHVPL